jgi:hypothetical protein
MFLTIQDMLRLKERMRSINNLTYLVLFVENKKSIGACSLF